VTGPRPERAARLVLRPLPVLYWLDPRCLMDDAAAPQTVLAASGRRTNTQDTSQERNAPAGYPGVSTHMTHLRSIHPQKSAVSNRRSSEQDVCASGFSWVAREPELMYGAKGARILTEINRLPRSPPSAKGLSRGNRYPFWGSFSAGRVVIPLRSCWL